jgi:hypothetical protein
VASFSARPAAVPLEQLHLRENEITFFFHDTGLAKKQDGAKR